MERRQLVESFYRAFRAMVENPAYSPKEWEAHPRYHLFDDMDEDEYHLAKAEQPYGGERLRTLRSSRLELWLNGESDQDRQLPLFPDSRQPNRTA